MKFKELYQSPMKERNGLKYGVTDVSCICCNKPTNEEYFIHMEANSWLAVPAKYTEEDLKINGYESQGLFAIGPSCAKKMGKKYIINA